MIDILDFSSLADAQFSLAEAKAVTFPLLLFVIGIFIYAWFIFKFYRFLAKRDVFELNLREYSESFIGGLKIFLSGVFYVLEYLLILPFFTFFWFGVIALMLAMLSKSNVESILLVAMALVGGVRMTAYYNEKLSRDLAKMLPFALLGIFLVDVSFFSFQTSLETLKQFPSQWKLMAYYLLFIVLLEVLLRILYGISTLIPKKENTEEEPQNTYQQEPQRTYQQRPQNTYRQKPQRTYQPKTQKRK